MNTIHDNGENDKSLSEGLDELKQSYGRLPKDEPPELLDQAILNKARRAVEKKPHWMKFSWLHGLTTAAVFVLAFTIIINLREQIPVIEEEMSTNEPVLRQREKSAKKQTSDIQPDAGPSELRVEIDKSQGFIQTIPTSAPMGNTEQETASDEDAVMGVHPKEELAEDKPDLMLDSLRETVNQKPARPAALAEPATNELESREKNASEAQQKLLTIIKLKRSGDSNWKTELESFRKVFPDYPIPDELKQ